ncbi:PLDc N-terminal domain-containing protein [Cohnella panacarvi]|uniref:PLDc N-terminal domain-containing protein n=1 Tax=Cohnella panacarvi TaxID=400776 RepID=UPI00047C43CB|nr:PLDc N-terminal domain-containing protein [Cohnella panacarvi]
MKWQDVNWELFAPLIAIQVVLLIIALIDLGRRDKDAVRGSKLLWVFVVVLVNLIGPVLYFTVGRKNES